MTNRTVFADMRQSALAVYRVTTAASVYIVGFHEEGGRRSVVVRGSPGSDREHVIIRDSDPRIGDASMFAVAPEAWIGKVMAVATMTSSPVTAVVVETDRASILAVGGEGASARSPWARPVPWSPPAPPMMSDRPCIAPGKAVGTRPAELAPGLAHRVVVGQPASPQPELPYPQRHVRHAEDAASLLRSVGRRDRLFDDIANDRELRDRLRKALDDCADLLEHIRRRDRR